MQKILLAIVMFGVLPAVAQNDADHPAHVKYTKHQRQAAGFWKVTEPHQGANVEWLVIRLGDSKDTMGVRWPTGLGCQDESAEIRGATITVVGNNFPAVIQILGPKTATLSMFGGKTILHMIKTRHATDFGCE
jgi:hypothetical protein